MSLIIIHISSIKESQYFTSDMSVSSFFMCEYSLVCRYHQVSELSWWQNVTCPLFKVGQGQVIAGTDNSALVDSADEFDDNFLGAVIIDNLKLPDVAVGLHEFEELDDEFGDGSDEDLFFAFPFGVDDGLEAIGEDVHFHH